MHPTAASRDEGTERQLRDILLQQHNAVENILGLSRQVLDAPERFSVDTFEGLLRKRADYIEQIALLEKEWSVLCRGVGQPDEELRILQRDIQTSINALMAVDERISGLVAQIQESTINKMVITSKLLKLKQGSMEEPRAEKRVLDITR